MLNRSIFSPTARLTFPIHVAVNAVNSWHLRVSQSSRVLPAAVLPLRRRHGDQLSVRKWRYRQLCEKLMDLSVGCLSVLESLPGVQQDRRSQVKEKLKEKEAPEMTLGLYECLRATGLQHHYERFTSLGVCNAAHLSVLTMQDYPILGIHSMEDQNRLFHLIQLTKSLDLGNLGYEDDTAYADGDGTSLGNDHFTLDSYKNQRFCNKDANGAPERRPNICRRLDFSCKDTEHPQELSSSPVGAAHVYASQNSNDEPVWGKGSTTPVYHEFDTAGFTVCACKGRCSNHRPEVHSRPSHLHTRGGGVKTDMVEGNCMCDHAIRLSPNGAAFHRPRPRPAAVASKRCGNKPVGYKDRKGISLKEKVCTEIVIDTASEHMLKPTPVYESKRTAGYNYGLPLDTPFVSNRNRQAGKQRITVCVRKRPLTRADSRRGEEDVVTTPGGACVIVHESKEALDLTEYILQHKFYFDQVFGENDSNEEVYQRSAYPLVQHMLNGGKATCFAYGQTGAGKTHTMLGSSPGRPGLYALAVQDIFAHLDITHTPSPSLVYVSFFEIYCGQLYDLLNGRKRLFAREDGQRVVHIAGLHNVRVDSVNSLLEVITKGTEERTQGASGVNPVSSRSHALLQIQLRHSNQQIIGRLWFVDLAGSERASDTKEPDKQNRMEGAEINQSLLALKECIRSLDQEQSHTPFRQSKLTQVLKDSFVGDSMTCMIANISPGHLATEHTMNTLRYADRVKELRGQTKRGGRTCKTAASAKRNLSKTNLSSGFGTRGKSPPKKPKIGMQRGAFDPTTLSPRIHSRGENLCSTPKSTRRGEEPRAWARKGMDQISPVRGSGSMGDVRHDREQRDGRQMGEERYEGPNHHSVRNQSTQASLEHPIAEQLYSWELPRDERDQEHNRSFAQMESGFYQRKKDKQERTLKSRSEEEMRYRQQRRHLEKERNTCVQVEKTGERDSQKVGDKDEERERHLRQYHQQLQQFTPTSASPSSSTCPSLSSSNQPSLSTIVSPSFHPSLRHLSVSAQMQHDLEEVLKAYGARVEVRADSDRERSQSLGGHICLQIESPPSYSAYNHEESGNNTGSLCKEQGFLWKETEALPGRGKYVKKRLPQAAEGGDTNINTEERRPAAVSTGDERWAWVPTGERDRRAHVGRADLGAEASFNANSGERQRIDGSGDGLQSTEEGTDMIATHSLLIYPPVESPQQKAPAERPLSPTSQNSDVAPAKFHEPSVESKHTGCTSNNLPVKPQNGQQQVSLISSRQMDPHHAANVSKKETVGDHLAALPIVASDPPNGCELRNEPFEKESGNLNDTRVRSHTDVKSKVLPQEEPSMGSASYAMEPLSMSLLDVDQQPATASFLQGEQDNTLLRLTDMNEGDVKFSLLELPQVTTDSSPTSALTASDVTELRKNSCCLQQCKLGMMDILSLESLVPFQQCKDNSQTSQTQPATETLGDKAPSSAPNSFPYASVQTTSLSLGSPISYADKHHSLCLDHDYNPNIPLHMNSSTESNNQEPLDHRSTLGQLDHAQLHVVQAHWKQLEEMEALYLKDGLLLCQQPDMTFGDYVHKLEEILERKAECVHSMRTQLQPYLRNSRPSDKQKKQDPLWSNHLN